MTSTIAQLTLSAAECDIVEELLERAQRDLSIEIHHTSSREFRHLLRDRLNLVEQLLERIRTVAAE